MNARSACPATWLLVLLAFAFAAQRQASAEENDKADGADDKKMAGKDKDGGGDAKSDESADKDEADAPATKGMKDKRGGASGKAPTSKIYFFKSQKKTKLAGAEVTNLIVQDVFSGKKETLVVPDAAVAAAVDGMAEGTPIQVETARKGGKSMVTSLAKADVQPGEEQPNGFVYVSTDENKDRGGNKTVTVTLRKFGREIKVGVPMWKNTNFEEPTWEPDSTIDGQLQQLEKGEVVAALIKNGRPPMLIAIYPYEPPERGKFVKVKEALYNGAAAAAFEMVAADGTTITVILPGTEKKQGEQKFLQPDMKTWRALQKIKEDTEIEVLFREEGQAYFLIDIKFLEPADKKASKGSKEAKSEEEKTKAGDAEEDPGADKAGGAEGAKKG